MKKIIYIIIAILAIITILSGCSEKLSTFTEVGRIDQSTYHANKPKPSPKTKEIVEETKLACRNAIESKGRFKVEDDYIVAGSNNGLVEIFYYFKSSDEKYYMFESYKDDANKLASIIITKNIEAIDFASIEATFDGNSLELVLS